MEQKTGALRGLLWCLSSISDPRQATKVEYPLEEVLFLTLCATLSGCTEWQEVVDFGEDKLAWLRQYRPYKNGIPSHDTVNRCVSLIEPSAFEAMFVACANDEMVFPPGTLISLDGKRLRGSATKLDQQLPRAQGGKNASHVLEAWCGAFSACLSIAQVADKSNEIMAIPLVLNDLEVSGCIVSIDAIGCQKEVAKDIVARGADYVLALKRNQPNLLEAVEAAFLSAGAAADSIIDTTVDHGRVEQRSCSVLGVESLPAGFEKGAWQNLTSLVQIKTKRTVLANSDASEETRYYISSRQASPQEFAAAVRGHWDIENKLHWALDVILGEDASRKRAQNAAANFGTILRIALNLLYADQTPISLKRKIKKAARSDAFRAALLRFD